MFETKVRLAQAANAKAVIVIGRFLQDLKKIRITFFADNTAKTDAHTAAPFAMSGDQQKPDTYLPTIFLHAIQTGELMWMIDKGQGHKVRVGVRTVNPSASEC
jgi:hypothetical protein